MLIRAVTQLKLDFLISKVSHITAPSAAHPQGTCISTFQATFDPSTQSTKAANPSAVPFGKVNVFGQPWTISTLLGTITYSKRSCSFTKTCHMDGVRRTEKKEEVIAQYRAPGWLMSRAWEVQAFKAISGWTFRPRTYNVIDRRSSLFEYARDGHIEGIHELFRDKKASPYDCDPAGFTALHVRQIPQS